MELLKEIANVSGKSGLYRILKPGRGGVIVETLDEKRERSMLGATARVSVLKDISIFLADSDKSMPLADIFVNVHAQQQGEPMDVKAMSDYQLVDFMNAVTPGYDTERVYLSDIRKVANWYNTLIQYLPEIFETKAEEGSEAVAEIPTEPETTGENLIETVSEVPDETPAEVKTK